MAIRKVLGPDTGIFQRVTFLVDRPGEAAEAAPTICSQLRATVDVCEAILRRALGSDVDPDIWDELASTIASPRRAELQEMLNGLSQIDLERVNDAALTIQNAANTWDAITKGDSKEAAKYAMAVGIGITHLVVRNHESAAMVGKKVKRGGKEGNQRAYGNDDEKEEEKAKRRAVFNAIYPAQCRKKTQAYRLAANQLGVSIKTIQRAFEK